MRAFVTRITATCGRFVYCVQLRLRSTVPDGQRHVRIDEEQPNPSHHHRNPHTTLYKGGPHPTPHLSPSSHDSITVNRSPEGMPVRARMSTKSMFDTVRVPSCAAVDAH